MYKEQDELMKRIFRENGYIVDSGEEDEQLELDSLQFISIICDIEENFNVSVPDDFLSGEKLNTYNDILQMAVQLGEAIDEEI